MKEILVSDVCNVCCECINICSSEVLGIREGKVKALMTDNCTLCEVCVDICPYDCIEVEI